MKVIYKYPLELQDSQFLLLPEAHQVLSVQVQNERLYLWASVDTDFPIEKVQIRIIGTGHPILFDHENYFYVATVQMNTLVWHVFESIWEGE